MSSILTNVSAMTALQSLTQTNKNLEMTQARIATGFKVASAADNAAYWSIATTMRSDNKALTTVLDALGLGAAKVDVAYTGVNAAIDVVDEIKAKLVAAREPGVDKTKIQSEITALQNQLTSNAGAASFSGENWLSVDSSAVGYSATKSIVASFTRSATGTVSVSTININTASVKLFDAAVDAAAAGTGILDGKYDAAGVILADQSTTPAGYFTVATINISTATVTAIDGFISGVDNAISKMTTAASDLGAAKKRVGLQQDFVGKLMDSIERGVGQLVDADMSEESTRLQALQVQQQLGIQALSIANANSQNVLSLFRS
jgi:flagellin